MLRVDDVIRRLLPFGTKSDGTILDCPRWPPDLFAVAATLVSLSGCYAMSRYVGGLLETGGCFDRDYMKDVHAAGEEWRSGRFPAAAQQLWTRLTAGNFRVAADATTGEWWDDAMRLLAIADLASVGFGFGLPHRELSLAKWVFEQILTSERRNVARTARRQSRGAVSPQKTTTLPYVPTSLCIAVPPWEACVQPKTRTPQVGCTLRALSHNLALLPSDGDVKTMWRYAAPFPRWKKEAAQRKEKTPKEPFNLLVVPFPYAISGRCFRESASREVISTTPDPENRFISKPVSFFSIEQEWLREPDIEKRLTKFLGELVTNAEHYVQKVHGIVLPEMALSEELAESVSRRVARNNENIELFISGVSARTSTGLAQNRTYCEIFSNGERHAKWEQSKHHRWKLDQRQVRNYNLGHALSQNVDWWEQIDVSQRECSFHVFREGASLAVLICEDLARIDPVQSVLRSIGPNLVIALLLDGPQLERRWPGRYATVLADDPGSAVLTLTSMGLMRRIAGNENKVALWKDPQGGTRELELPNGCHGLVLSLTPGEEENFCSDWRSDHGASMRLTLSEAFAVKVGQDDLSWLNAR